MVDRVCSRPRLAHPLILIMILILILIYLDPHAWIIQFSRTLKFTVFLASKWRAVRGCRHVIANLRARTHVVDGAPPPLPLRSPIRAGAFRRSNSNKENRIGTA